MAFPMKKKPDFSLILGMRKPVSESGPPDMMGASEPEPDPADPNEESEKEGADLTPAMLNYHSGADNCGSCSHFTAPSTCDRFPDPVEENAWCSGFQAGGDAGQFEDQMPGQGSEAMGAEDQAA